MKNFNLYIVSLLLLSIPLKAQTTKTITLQDGITLAVEHSKQLKIAEADLQQAQARVAQARDHVWPEIKASATYLHINTPNVSVSGASDNNSGGTGSNPLAATFSKLHDIGLAQLTLSEPIFAGFKIRNNRLMEQYLSEAAQYDVTTAKSTVIVNTVRALFQYYELLESKKAIDQHMKQAEQRVIEFKNLEAQGLLAKNDRLKAELQTNNIRLTQTELQHSLELAEFNLQILLGIPQDTKLTLDTTGMFQQPAVNPYDKYVELAAANRSVLKSAQMQVHAAEAATKVAKSGRYPTLALSGGYVNAYLPNVMTVTNALNGGLALQYNLTGAIHSKHMMQEAKARQRKAELSAELAQDQVQTSLKKQYLDFQRATQKISLSQNAIEQARENFDITRNKFDAGLVILSDYLDADLLLLQAQINLATAKAERMISFYELEEAAGNIK